MSGARVRRETALIRLGGRALGAIRNVVRSDTPQTRQELCTQVVCTIGIIPWASRGRHYSAAGPCRYRHPLLGRWTPSPWGALVSVVNAGECAMPSK